MNAIELHNISKSYGKVHALHDVSFSVDKGELFGLIGADGAGKTSLFRILTTLILADKGTAMVDGNDVVKDYKAIRKSVGYMPGRFSLYGDMTVKENLNFFASIFGTTLEKNRDMINDIYTQIEPFNNRRASKLSGGMKQKLALCCALIHKPTVLFLDEPTTGVDPVSRKEFWEMLHQLKKGGISILTSTPYMDEAGQCDRMAFIKEGQILTIDTPQDIVNKFDEPLYAISTDRMHTLLPALRSYKAIKECYTFGEYNHFTIKDNSFSTNDLDAFLTDKGYKDIVIKPITATVEDCYLKLSDS